jgi:hypothetical protein
MLLIGGFNVFGSNASLKRTFTSLVAHDKVKISLEVILIDTWDSEIFFIKSDTVQVYSITSLATEPDRVVKILLFKFQNINILF